MAINKKPNQYQQQIDPRLYALCPKAVFAAIAVSPVMNGAAGLEDKDTPDAYLLREWGLLHRQGIVPQPVPTGFQLRGEE